LPRRRACSASTRLNSHPCGPACRPVPDGTPNAEALSTGCALAAVSPAVEHWYAGSLQLEAEALGSRRGHGEGSIIFQRTGDGKWLAVLEIGRDPATGKRVRRTITAATRREAAQRLRALRDQLDRGAINVDGRATIGQWSERWLEHVQYRRDVTDDLRPNTAASYERLTRATSSVVSARSDSHS
jgi:hypothetical protein